MPFHISRSTHLAIHIIPVAVALIIVSPVSATTPPASTPQATAVDNGCPRERATPDFLCPLHSDPGHAYIEYIYSDHITDAIAVKLTDDGLEHALTCDGASDITRMVIDLYAQFPESERAQDSIEWAASRMADELHAHAHLGQNPDLLPTANPVEIDFPHYRGRYPVSLGGLEKIGEQILFNKMWACPPPEAE